MKNRYLKGKVEGIHILRLSSKQQLCDNIPKVVNCQPSPWHVLQEPGRGMSMIQWSKTSTPAATYLTNYPQAHQYAHAQHRSLGCLFQG